MLHNRTSNNPQGDHYGASCSLNDAPEHCAVLAQIQEGPTPSYPHTEQARIRLTPDEARHFAQLLLAQADRVEAHIAALAQAPADSAD